MPRYRVTNRVTKEVSEVEAPFAQVACERLGWMIGNCFVECIREGPFTDIRQKERRVGC
ncbi:MAG: hypothetical protein ACE5K3_00950 [bacterium]